MTDSFELPLPQEMLADCLGLTSVHVNLRSLVDYQPLTASGEDS